MFVWLSQFSKNNNFETNYAIDFFLFLSTSFNKIFLSLKLLGVTSTYSSFCIYSKASSRENFIAGTILALSSAPDFRRHHNIGLILQYQKLQMFRQISHTKILKTFICMPMKKVLRVAQHLGLTQKHFKVFLLKKMISRIPHIHLHLKMEVRSSLRVMKW